MSCEVLDPSYSSMKFPLANHKIVGYPRTGYFSAGFVKTVASIIAKTAFSPRILAAFSYSGYSFLQWPHHGA